MKKTFVAALVTLVALCLLAPSAPDAGSINDIVNKVRKGKKDEGVDGKGNRLLKVSKKTAAFQGFGTSKFFYVIYHAESTKPLTVKFVARGSRDDEFELPEVSWGGATTNGEQWDWEKSKGYLPKYFSKTKVGRRIAKFEHNQELNKKYGQVKAYNIVLLDNNTVIDSIRWNWDDKPYQRGIQQ
ncbi:MAG TPA: hypothetical protein P5287_03940 [bacterium]|nr:hypothetical protein [bacterium]